MSDERIGASPDGMAGQHEGGQEKAASVILGLERRKKKEARVKREALAAERRARRKKCGLEEASKRRQRERATMHSYFGTSRNSENRVDLEVRQDRRSREEESAAAMELLHLDNLGGEGGASAEPDLDVTIDLSILGVVSLTSDSSAYIHSEDDPAARHVPSESEEPEPDLSDSAASDDDGVLDLPLGKRRKTAKLSRISASEGVARVGSRRWKSKYDLTRKYQLDWAAKAPWSEGVLKEDGLLHAVKCTICTAVGRKPCLMGPKWDTIQRHGKRKCHEKNALLYAARRPTSVLEQIQGCTSAESRRKRVQFATMFHLLCHGRPMSEFTSRFELYKFLSLPDLPAAHWSGNSGWIIAEHIYDLVKKRQTAMIHAAQFIALSADETSTVDNTSVIAIHAYVLSDWGRQSLMIALTKLESDGATADSLTRVIMSALLVNCNLDRKALAAKLLCFGADGVAAFQGQKNGVTKQIKQEFAPFTNGQHCCAHKLQLAAQVLSETELLGTIEDVLQTTHAYFAHSPKRITEFRTLAHSMEQKA